MAYYEQRYISHLGRNNITSLFEENTNYLTILQNIENFSKIVLLGDPGVGKTTELTNLFEELWKKKETTGVVPIFIDLKYFRKGDNIESKIKFKEWKELPQVVFILDGLDEMVDIQDFISNLEVFIAQNSDISAKYIISCRTNIYDKFLVQISGFEIFVLNALNYEQAQSILKKKYEITLPNNYNKEDIIDAFNTPFFLDLFAKYYREKKTWPNSFAEIWDLYINKTIETDKIKFKKRGIINNHKIIHSLKKVALTNELMQQNFTLDNDLFRILKEDYEDLEENSLIKLDSETKKWSFFNRQIQEYLVAKSLVDLDYKEILDFLKIDKVDAVHPSLYNSLAFTIDLLHPQNDKDKYTKLILWLQHHQIDVLFKADSNRFNDDLREIVFQSYFKQECIDKTFWINTNRSIEVKEISEFGNTPKNFTYLKKIISKLSYHYRIRYSALELISFFSIPVNELQDFKEYLLSMLKEEGIEAGIKAQIINCIIYQNLYTDIYYVTEILKSQKNESNKEINRSLLNLIETQDNIDKYFNLLQQEFLRVHDIVPREVEDKVIRGNKYSVENLILRLEQADNFIQLARHYIERNLSDYNNFNEKLIKRLVYFIEKDYGFLYKVLDTLNEQIRQFSREDMLYKIVKTSKTEIKTIKYLLSGYKFNEVNFLIAKIVNDKSVDFVAQFIIEHQIESTEAERFRNYIYSLNSPEIALKLNNLLVEKGYNFERPLITEEQSVYNANKFKLSLQENIDVLFDPKRLLDEISILFKENNKIDIHSFRKIETNWYEENGSWNFLEMKVSFLSFLFYNLNYKYVTLEVVENAIQDKSIILTKLQTTIERYKSSMWEYKLSSEQIKSIESWINIISKEIDFQKIIELHSIGSYSQAADFLKLKAVFYYKQLLDIKLPKQFLLNSLRFYELDKSSEPDENFIELKRNIDDEKAFNNRIVENIKTGNLFAFSLSKHIAYAIQEELEESYIYIREYFKKHGDSVVNESKKMENYVLVSKDINLLKEVCIDPNTWVYWSAIGILIKHKWEKEFCLEKALTYLEKNEEKFQTDAVNVLLQLNSEFALGYIIQFVKNNSLSSLRFLNNHNYYSIKDYSQLESLYFLFYSNKIDYFDQHFARSFYQSLILNIILNKEDEFEKVLKILYGIRSKTKKRNEDLFYINLLINDFRNTYVNLKSKPFTLKQAIKKADEILA